MQAPGGVVDAVASGSGAVVRGRQRGRISRERDAGGRCVEEIGPVERQADQVTREMGQGVASSAAAR